MASARDPIPTYFFAMVIARKGERFLVVHERKHGQGWYLPAGRVEAGERIVDAAARETLEESGIHVQIDGVLRVEHTPGAHGDARCRVFFTATPVGEGTPRTVPNEHSLGAAWVTLDELDGLRLRGDEVREVFRYVAEGGAVHPVSLLTFEGDPWRPR